jgi:transcriptional regulator with GAF, ATPase, and Fis domain
MSYSEPPPEETRLAPLLAPALLVRPRVSWTDGTGHHTKTIDGRTIVGSAQSSGIVIADPTVSRLHAELEQKADGLWVRDLGSRNGTFVEGLQILAARVPDKGRIKLGGTELVVDQDPSQRRAVEVWPNDHFGRLVGTSAKMRELFANLGRISPMDASVLIQGETGTGKELVARAIHDASPRVSKPFIVVDCAALPENLLDAELFGHTKGAFTGAIGARIGAIEAAEGGTVFLDEIGELPISMQPKLLRVLESHTVRRVGETTYRSVDVRFISATHRDLLTMVNDNEFREDLYFRLSVIPVSVPPLRARLEDIERLVNHFLGGASSVSPELMRELINRPWRGNVRELRNFVDRARALGASEALALSAAGQREEETPAPGARVSLQAIPNGVLTPPAAFKPDDAQMFEQAYKDFREAWIDAGEKEYVRRLLARHTRNVAAAAREAEIDRTYIYRLIRKHEL